MRSSEEFENLVLKFGPEKAEFILMGRRRRQAASRLEALPCGCRDPYLPSHRNCG